MSTANLISYQKGTYYTGMKLYSTLLSNIRNLNNSNSYSVEFT
jgi:hypothetical protein